MHHTWQSLLEEPPARDRHLVQFYTDPGFLQRAVASWSARSLAQGGGAVLIATRAHADLVRARLAADRLDPRRLERQGRLSVVDAEAALAEFMSEGKPDAPRFHRLVKEVVADVRASSGGPGTEVRAWGELVNLLWKGGNLPAAQRLEALWNDAVDANGLRLLCSYHVDNLDPATHGGLLKDLTLGHSQLILQEDYDRLDQDVARALREVFGPTEAATLWELFTARQAGALGMPAGEAVLVGLHDVLPQMGTRVLLLTRQYATLRGASA